MILAIFHLQILECLFLRIKLIATRQLCVDHCGFPPLWVNFCRAISRNARPLYSTKLPRRLFAIEAVTGHKPTSAKEYSASRCEDHTGWLPRSFARRQYRGWRFLRPVQSHHQINRAGWGG
jgi:hypothetical protein